MNAVRQPQVLAAADILRHMRQHRPEATFEQRFNR